MSSNLIESKKAKQVYKCSKKPRKLSVTDRVFCAEWMANGMNSTAATMVTFPHLSKKSASTGRLLKKPAVKAYLSDMLHTRLSDAGLSCERLLRKLEVVLFLDPMDLFEPGDIDGVYEMKSLDDIPAEVRECIKKFKMKSRTDEMTGDVEIYFEVEFMDKDKALATAMAYQGMINDGKGGVNINLPAVPTIDFDRLCGPPEIAKDGSIIDEVVESE